MNIEKYNKYPLVSVCVPLYNAEEWVEETITRLQKQTYPNIEIIIVDDHSTDNSLQIVKRYESENIRIYTNPQKGGNAARNYAFKMSHGEYMKFMDADDYMDDDTIEKQMLRLLEEPNRKQCIIFSPLLYTMPDGSEHKVKSRDIDKDYTPGIELLIDSWRDKGHNCPHCHLMHRSMVELSGGWNEELTKNQDGEFFGRLYSLAAKAICVNDTNAYWRRTFSGVSNNNSAKSRLSVLKSYTILTECILKYKDNSEMRKLCTSYIAQYIWNNDVSVTVVSSALDAFLKKYNLKLHVPNPKYKYIEKMIGFKNCLAWKIFRANK